MRKSRISVLTGIAALAVAGVGFAAGRDMHVMKVDLPDGSVARIEYRGDVAPTVTMAPTPAIVPVRFVNLFDDAPFAAFDRIAAEMDRRATALLQEASAFQTSPMPGDGKLDLAAVGKMPAGTVHYEFVSTSNGRDVCNRRFDVTSYGPAQKPKVISASSGACSPAASAVKPANAAPETRATVPEMHKTDANSPSTQSRAKIA